MGILILILIGIGIYILYQYFAVNSPEKIIQENEDLATTLLSSEKAIGKSIYGREELDEHILLMRDWYARLKEKYKHDKTKLMQLAKDWKDYAYYFTSKSTSVYLWIEEDDKENADEMEQEIKEKIFAIEEIENRFAHLLGDEYKKKLDELRTLDKEKADLLI